MKWKGILNIFLRHFKTLADSWLDLLFPRICIHCQTLAEEEHSILCKVCFSELEFTQSEERCKACGQSKQSEVHCPFCQKKPSPFFQVLSAFDLHSPAAFTLQRKYQNPSHSFLTKGAGALMALHYANKGLKWPEVIAPCPANKIQELTRGFCPATELAKLISAILQVPMVHALTPPIFGGSQKMRYNPRMGRMGIEEKKVLLVGDYLNPPFFEAGEALAEGNPHSIYGLTFFSNAI
jgi:predicted amidophosphoribosyltransferase